MEQFFTRLFFRLTFFYLSAETTIKALRLFAQYFLHCKERRPEQIVGTIRAVLTIQISRVPVRSGFSEVA